MICCHRYRIAEPNGERLLPGVCQLCGHERMYRATDHDNGKVYRLGSVSGTIVGMGKMEDERASRLNVRKAPSGKRP